MTPSLPQRIVALAAIALLAAITAIAVVEHGTRTSATSASVGTAEAPGGWNQAFAGSRGPAGDAQRTTCGQVLTPNSLGVTQPVLPCGAKIVLRNDGKQVLTEVIDNKLVVAGRQLEVTERLAKILGLEGTQEIDWRFATDTSG
ncbi:MAG TPA: hypothetical protein VFK76_07920 [Gaiellaceae bacterium]|nr:hypothetical protein [Gaiellaceae bacterium]